MADIVTVTLDTLTAGLRPFVRTQLESAYDDDWPDAARRSFRADRNINDLSVNVDDWDAHALLTVMWDHWNEAFRSKLGLFERSLVAELRAFRNRWAHQGAFNFDDTYRLLDSVQRLLTAIQSTGSTAISELKFELLKDEFGEAINAQAAQNENRRERWVTSFVYLMCGCVLLYLLPLPLINLLGNNESSAAFIPQLSAGLRVAVGMAIAYLIYLRFRHRPVQVGPRECRRCHRIIYGTNCPYCTSSAMFDSSDFRLGEAESDEVTDEKVSVPR